MIPFLSATHLFNRSGSKPGPIHSDLRHGYRRSHSAARKKKSVYQNYCEKASYADAALLNISVVALRMVATSRQDRGRSSGMIALMQVQVTLTMLLAVIVAALLVMLRRI